MIYKLIAVAAVGLPAVAKDVYFGVGFHEYCQGVLRGHPLYGEVSVNGGPPQPFEDSIRLTLEEDECP